MNLLNNGVNLFTPYIYKFQFPFEFEILKPKIYNLLENNSETSLLDIGNSKSSIKAGNTEQPHTWEELSEFQEWLGSMIYFIRKENKFIYEYGNIKYINIYSNKIDVFPLDLDEEIGLIENEKTLFILNIPLANGVITKINENIDINAINNNPNNIENYLYEFKIYDNEFNELYLKYIM